MSARDRFWAKVDKAGDCWVWTGGRTTNGYGTFRVDSSRTAKAHRVAWEAIHGPVPVGLELDHLCRNRACVRPDHLEAVPHRVNCLRGDGVGALAAVKDACPRGHAYSHRDRRGRRHCRTCDNRMRTERRQRQRAAA